MSPAFSMMISAATTSQLSEWIESSGDTVRLKIWIQPKAGKTGLIGEYDGRLKIKVKSPPIDDRANQELCRWLAKQLGLSAGSVRVRFGRTDRRKVVEVTGSDLSVIREKLTPDLSE